MNYCPECGGDMAHVWETRRYVCKSCGLSVTHQELFELRQRARELRVKLESDEEGQRKDRKEYLKWWLGKKK